MFGYHRDELLGAEIEMLLPQRLRSIHVYHRAGFTANPRVRAMGAGLDLWARRKEGTEFPIEIGLSYLETADGNLALGPVTDITERKRAAHELAGANEDLRRSNTELEQFAYLASHDLQEPLRMITSYLNLLEQRCRGKLDEDGEEFLQYAVEGAERMKRLIRDFLAVSRISRQALILEASERGEIVENALQNLAAAIDESHAEIRVGPGVSESDRERHQIPWQSAPRNPPFGAGKGAPCSIFQSRRKPPNRRKKPRAIRPATNLERTIRRFAHLIKTLVLR